MSVTDPAARRRLVWLLLTRGDLAAERLRSDGLPVLRGDGYGGDDPARSASASSKRASGSSRRSPKSSRS
jgi:hypothetical protein